MSHRNQILQSREIGFAYRISFLANFFAASVYRQVASRHALARSEFVVIFCLSRLGELTAQDVCDITGRPKNSVSRAVNALLERGYVKRRVDELDARRSQLTLTRSGQELYAAVLPLFAVREEAMLAPLNTREREQLDRLLAKLVLRDDDWAGVAGDGM